MNISLSGIKEQFIKTQLHYSKVFDEEYNDKWESGLFILRTTLNENFNFRFLYSLIDINNNSLNIGESDLLDFDKGNKFSFDLKYHFKQGITSGSFNEIQIKVENKEFVSYTPVLNQAIIDNFNKNQYLSQPYRSKYNGTFKPWYLDKGNFTELSNHEISNIDSAKINSFTSLTNYLKSISISNKDRWDCTFLKFQILDFSSIASVTKEEYVYLENQDINVDNPHAFIYGINFNSEDLKKIFEGFKIENFCDVYTIEFQLKADFTFEYYFLDGNKSWIKHREVNVQSLKKFEKEKSLGLNKELNQSNQPVYEDYLLQNIYGCISKNVPDDFEIIEAVIIRSFDGDTQQFSGTYSYQLSSLLGKSKPVEPGEQVYPINIVVRLLNEFYTEQSKNWRKAVLTFKNDGTCSVKIGK